MSLILSNAMYQGDPGLFSSIGHALGSIGGKVLRTVGGAARGFASGGILGGIKGGIKGTGLLGSPRMMSAGKIARFGGGAAYNLQAGSPWSGRGGPGGGAFSGLVPIGGLAPMGGSYPVSTAAPSPGTAMVPGGSCGVSGYHLNKSGYWANQSNLMPGASWVAPGSKCVKNRHMNPLNPRALSRSMRRLSGFTRAARSAEKMISRLARASGGARRSCAPRGRFGKKCGCK